MIAYSFIYQYNKKSKRKDFTFNKISSKNRVDFVRQHILSILEKEDKQAYDAFNFRDVNFPDVIFQKPYDNKFSIYLKDSSKAIDYINILIASLFKNPIEVDGSVAELVKFESVADISIFPKQTENKIKYNLITPLILFSSKDKFPIYYAISTQNPSKRMQEQLLKEKAKDLIISNLKYQLQKQVGYKKYEVLDGIDIDWNDFDVKFIEYHKGEKKTPAIFGSFSSNWELPRFIGQKIGKGFGQINKARNFRDKKVA